LNRRTLKSSTLFEPIFFTTIKIQVLHLKRHFPSLRYVGKKLRSREKKLDAQEEALDLRENELHSITGQLEKINKELHHLSEIRNKWYAEQEAVCHYFFLTFNGLNNFFVFTVYGVSEL
jgi:hypothetical protein